MKKSIVIASFLMFLSLIAFVAAENLDIMPVKDAFPAGENITLKVSLYGSNSNPIDADVDLVIEDAGRSRLIEVTVSTNKLVDINLGEGAPAGYWKITATHQNTGGAEPTVSTALFLVESSELVRFEIKNNTLNIINIGNTKYAKPVQIVIGETIGTKEVDLGVGESVSFRLVAPSGTYNVKVTDGKTTLATSNIVLTGNVIGILDNRQGTTGPITSGARADESPYGDQPSDSGKDKTLVYIFLIVLFAAAILLVIERKYRKSALRLTNYQLSN